MVKLVYGKMGGRVLDICRMRIFKTFRLVTLKALDNVPVQHGVDIPLERKATVRADRCCASGNPLRPGNHPDFLEKRAAICWAFAEVIWGIGSPAFQVLPEAYMGK